jgi:hypothetical protein
MYDASAQFHRTRSIAIIIAAVIFVACVAATSAWVVHSFAAQTERISLPANSLTHIPGTPDGPRDMPVIGGVVRNAQGDGIPNVRVRLNWNEPQRPKGQNEQSIIVSTDVSGHWSYDGIPRTSLETLGIWLAHRDYVATNPHVAAPALLEKSSVLTITRGVDIRGTVVDSLGWPISNAQVFAPAFGPQGAQPRATTNDRGEFTLRHVPPNANIIITAKHVGFAAAVVNLQTNAQPPPLKLLMPVARLFAGTVIDASGKPVPDATVTIQRWNGFDQPGNVRVNTDAQGRYEIRDAPPEALDVLVSKGSFYDQTRQLASGVSQLDFVLSPVITARGRITDAKTKQPINEFKLFVGCRGKPFDAPVFDDTAPHPFNNGRFNITFDAPTEPTDAWFVRIEAKGYLPATSPAFTETARHDLELQPAPPDPACFVDPSSDVSSSP